MSRTLRALVATAALFATSSLTGCALFGIPTEDDFPDDYEQALIDTLDEAEIVVQHSADIDAWERTSSIPPYEAPVEITPRANQEQIEELLTTMIEVAATHEQPLPGFDFSSNDLHFSLVASGDLTADFAADGIDVALRDGWGSVSIFGGESGNSAYLSGGVTTTDAAIQLVTTPLPASIQDALSRTRLTVAEISENSDITGSDSMISVDAINAAAAIEPLVTATPTADGSANYDLTSSLADGMPNIDIRIEVRAEGLNDAEPEDRPGIAADLGYTDFCHDIEDAAADAIADSALSFRCVATHVDID